MRALIIASLLALLPHTATAQSAADAVTKWGLVGTWRLTCGEAPTRPDPDLKYSVQRGKVIHDREFGAAPNSKDILRDTNEVVAAKTVPGGMLEVRVRFPQLNATREYSLIKGPDGRMRTGFNRSLADNSYTIRDGIVVANGQQSMWLTRCR